MNGMDPPSPYAHAGAPKHRCEAASSASRSHGANAGAFQPLPVSVRSNRTDAPYGASARSASLTASRALSASHVGGRRSESRSEVDGRSTLPAFVVGGSPSAPVTVRAGAHV